MTVADSQGSKGHAMIVLDGIDTDVTFNTTVITSYGTIFTPYIYKGECTRTILVN